VAEQWNEIEVEVKSPASVKTVETAEADRSEQEVAPVKEQAETPALKIKGDTDGGDGSDADEAQALDGIKTDGAQKRIRKLVRQKREIAQRFQSELATEKEKREALEARLANLETAQQRSQETQLVTHERTLEERLTAAQRQWQEAFDAGDKDAMVRANEAQMDAKVEKARLADWKRQRQAAPKQTAAIETKAVEADDRVGESGGEASTIHPKAREWIGKQAWWDKDRVMTAATVAIAGELEAEGFDPGDDDYYGEVEKRLRSELPHKFREPATSKPTQVVAGQSRSPAPNKVRLTSEDQRLARVMGLSLEDYARSKQEADNAKGGYVAIDTTRRK
jgi:hypothetical protein